MASEVLAISCLIQNMVSLCIKWLWYLGVYISLLNSWVPKDPIFCLKFSEFSSQRMFVWSSWQYSWNSNCFEILYFSRSLWQSLFYHAFEYLVMLTTFEYLNHNLSILLANICKICSSISLSEMFMVLSFVITSISSVMNFSSLLFLTNVCFLVWICSSIIVILTVRGA